MTTKTTKKPITVSGWYEHEDGTVGRYTWGQYGPVLQEEAADWAAVLAQPSYLTPEPR